MHFRRALSIWAAAVSASHVRHRNGVHSIPRETATSIAVVPPPHPTATATFAWPILARAKTTQLVCASGYNSCAQSLGGGCCAAGYVCAANACTATTSGPKTCQGTVNAYACPSSLGGGCCSVGSICSSGHYCIPTASAAPDYTCPTSKFMCAASFGYGCCRSGYGCATDSCYSTAPSTDVITQTTTDSQGSIVHSTITSIYTPSFTSAVGYRVTESKYQPRVVDKSSPVSAIVSVASGTATAQSEPLSTNAIIGISIGALAATVLIVCALLVTCSVWNIADSIRTTTKHVRHMMHSGRASRYDYGRSHVAGAARNTPVYPNTNNSAGAMLITPIRSAHRGHRYGESATHPLMCGHHHQRTLSEEESSNTRSGHPSDYPSSMQRYNVRTGERWPSAPWLSRQPRQGEMLERPGNPRNFSVASSVTPPTGASEPRPLVDVEPVVHLATEEVQEMPSEHDRESIQAFDESALGSSNPMGPLSPTNISDRGVISQYQPVDNRGWPSD